jgi:peroxiredoxin
MRLPLLAIALSLSVIIVALVHGADAKLANFDDLQSAWHELPGVDDQLHSLSDLQDKRVIVVAITCNHCPIALEYFDRLNDFASQHCGEEGQVALVAISLSDLETDKLPRMKELSHRHQFQFPYLHDSTQRVGKALGAKVTPQFFVLDHDRKLAYHGAWDDSVNAEKVKAQYVEDAVTALLSGKKPAVTESKARGCLISYKK